ncbi:MAG: flagellar motor switch protein FliG [Rhizobiales bacterium]|nr:flagellar motor switch protein FliG [Hyphomicrobiales bacterium]
MNQSVADANPLNLPEKVRNISELNGPERAGVLMLALGNEYGQKIWKKLEDDEIKIISVAMSKLGNIETDTVELLVVDFVTQLSSSGAILGSFDSTERLLTEFLDPERVVTIMEEIRGPAGRNMWEKLSNVHETVLANYLKNEYPQTVAVVLSKIRPEHAARVLQNLPEEFSLEVVERMLKMENVQKDILEKVEQTLRTEFMASLAQTHRRDAHESMADIFNNFDRQTESRFMSALEEKDEEAAEQIKALMFTFEDLGKLDSAGVQTLLRGIDKSKLAIALKGTTDTMRDFFLGNMTERAGKMLKEDMEVLGPVRLRDVDEAQTQMVNITKDLAAKGEIIISRGAGDEEMII